VPINPVPLAIGGGAVHSDDVLRRMINGLSRDVQGVALPGDFKVTATPTASGSVNVAPGGMVLRHHNIRGQSYFGDSDSSVPWSKNLTSAGYHLIVLKVVDPETSPWQPSGTPGAPNTSVANGPYFMLDTIPCSSNTMLASEVVTYAAEAIARVDNPTGAAAITNAMIKEVGIRRLAQPRIGFAYDWQPGPATANYVTVAETAWHHWPSNSLLVEVPRWATHAQATIQLVGLAVDGPCDVNTRVILGNLPPGPIVYFDYNGNAGTPAGFVENRPHFTFAEFDVRSLQGQTVTLRLDARRTYEQQNTGNVWFGPAEQIVFDVKFSERVV
jgi:hypothetical protein